MACGWRAIPLSSSKSSPPTRNGVWKVSKEVKSSPLRTILLAIVVPVALNKVFQLKVNGVAFRLIPESDQVKNALHEREKSGIPSGDFFGVPVFQSRSLVLKSQSKRYRPLFFRKEDLENSLEKAAGQLNRIKSGDIEVSALEDVIKEMKENSTSKWDDVIFIPPGFDVSTDSNRQ